MDFLFTHSQEKKDKRCENISKCSLNLYKEHDILKYCAEFFFEYKRFKEKKCIHYIHKLYINLKTGDIEVIYEIINDDTEREMLFRNTNKKTKNDFFILENLCYKGFLIGEKNVNFWGVNYINATDKIFNLIHKILMNDINNEYYKKKSYSTQFFSTPLYDLILDYHLDKKNIKGHDNIYYDIKYDYPNKNWLKKNDNKYLPAILDKYGIKSKYLISELSKPRDIIINIASVNYFCKLFGENYIDYLKKENWKRHCTSFPPNKHTHTLNEFEKKNFQILMKKHNVYYGYDSLLYKVNKILTIREQIKHLYYDLKFNPKNEHDLDVLFETWGSYKKYINRGYKQLYLIDENIKNTIENDIIVENIKYTPKILLSEDDFNWEGILMKNCMGKQFTNAAIYLFISLEKENKKRINLQYRKNGSLVQSYGKTNTKVPSIFERPISILTERIETIDNLQIKKIKYDITKL